MFLFIIEPHNLSMKRIIVCSLLLVAAISFSGCEALKQITAKDLVTFTTDIKQRLESNNIELKKVQFYIDQRVVLTRSLGSNKAEVKSGKVTFENGQYTHEIIIPALTAGVCEMASDGRLYISFEKEGSNIAFGSGLGTAAENFVLLGKNWDAGTAVVNYEGNEFKAKCSNCSNVGDVKLMIKKSELNKVSKTSRTVKGRKVE
jgi:hypothetical protein